MANNNNSTCSICGKEYYACLSCHDSIKANPWKVYTDTAEHYKIFQIVRGLSTKVYTKEEAKAKLKNINLNDIESFRPHIKQIIEDVLREEEPVAIVVEKVEKIEEPIQVEVAIEETVVEKPIVSRKRSYKVNNVEVNESIENRNVEDK